MNHPAPFDAWLFSLTCAAALTDARRGTIPNWLTLPTLALAPLAHAVQAGPGALAWSLAGMAACAIVPVVLFRRNAMGGGDVKLFAAAGALRGAHDGLELQMLSFVLAGTAAATWLACRGELGRVLQRAGTLVARSLWPRAQRDADALEGETSIRLGIAVFAACVLLAAKSAMGIRP